MKDILVLQKARIQSRYLFTRVKFSDINTCTPVRKLIFAKTHKTGSTTLQNLMFRYGTKNNLTFVLPNSKWWFFNHYRSFKASDAEDFNNANTNSTSKDIFAIHSVWNYNEIRKIIPNAPAVTILRDPIDVFESAYSYFGNNPTVGCFYTLFQIS